MTMKDSLVLWLVGSCAFFSLVGCHLLEQSAQVALCVLLVWCYLVPLASPGLKACYLLKCDFFPQIPGGGNSLLAALSLGAPAEEGSWGAGVRARTLLVMGIAAL